MKQLRRRRSLLVGGKGLPPYQLASHGARSQAGCYEDFAATLRPLRFAAEGESIGEGQRQGRRVAIARDPERGRIQSERRLQQIEALVPFGEHPAAKIEAQNQRRHPRGYARNRHRPVIGQAHPR